MALPTSSSPSFSDPELMKKLLAQRPKGQQRTQTLDMSELSMYRRVCDSGRGWPEGDDSGSEEVPENPAEVDLPSMNLADMVQREIGKEALPGQAVDYGKQQLQPRQPCADAQLEVTVERVLKSKQVQQAMRNHARKAAAEALESLLRSIATIEKDLSGRISTIEDNLRSQKADHGAGSQSQQQRLDAGKFSTAPTSTRGWHEPRTDPQGPAPNAARQLNPRDFNSDPRGGAPTTAPQRLDASAFSSDPRGQRPASQHARHHQQQQHQHQPPAQHHAEQAGRRSLSPARHQAAAQPVAPGPPPPPQNQLPRRPMTVKDIEAYQIEKILRESTLRIGPIAESRGQSSGSRSPSPVSPRTPPPRGGGGGGSSATRGGAAASDRGATFSVLPSSGRGSGNGAVPEEDITSQGSSNDNEGGQESKPKKKSFRIRNFINKRMGWDRSQTS